VRAPLQVFAGSDDLGDAAAALVLSRLAVHSQSRPFLLGCPGGRSASSTYQHLALRAATERVDLSHLVIVMMDEYVVADRTQKLVPVGVAEAHSCRRFGREQIIGQLNAALRASGAPASRLLPLDNLWLPDPDDPGGYDQRLTDAGGVDLFLLASGAGDGHVAFNPPGASADSFSRVVALPESTRRDNLVTFPSFGADLDRVPGHGVTVGIATIREQSREVVMIVHGPDKQLAARRLIEAEHYEPDWPATVLADCRSPHLFVDRAAYPSPTLAPAR